MSMPQLSNVLLSGAVSDVAVLRWPEESDERDRLSRLGLPRLLLIDGPAAPPHDRACVEDWVRLPATDDDIVERLTNLQARSRQHPPTPIIDDWGQVSFRDHSVFLSPVEHALAQTLVRSFKTAVREAELMRCAWPTGDGSANGLRVHVSRLRKRIAALDLTITTIRGYGYMMTEAHSS
jgi:hypothetical protein